MVGCAAVKSHHCFQMRRVGAYLRRVGARMSALPAMLTVASRYGARARSLSLVKLSRSY